MVHVYELRNATGKVEYVGTSHHPNQRLNEHTKRSTGLFYKRSDIVMYVVTGYETRKVAVQAEKELKIKNGLEPTEFTCGQNTCKKLRKLTMQQAEEIRDLFATGNYTKNQLGKQYNITGRSIGSIVRKETYQV